jgi:hypothetical protein
LNFATGLAFAGNPDLGQIIYAPLKSFYHDDFQEAGEIDEFDRAALLASGESYSRIYNPYADDYRKGHGAAILMQNHTMYSATGFTNAGYHGVASLAATLGTIKPAELSGLIPQRVTFTVGAGGQVDYGTRQHLEEYRAGLAAYTGDPNLHFPIHVHELNGKVRETNTQEWLPQPFSAADFGMDEQLSLSFANTYLAR